MMIQGNYFELMETIKNHIGTKPCFIFCDGGRKHKEFNVFVRILPKRSVIAAHDYPMEISDEQMKESIEEFNLVPICKEEWTGGVEDVRTCFFLKS
jgi:hypothetical protein